MLLYLDGILILFIVSSKFLQIPIICDQRKKKHEDDDVSSKIQINVYYITNIKDKVAKINK